MSSKRRTISVFVFLGTVLAVAFGFAFWQGWLPFGVAKSEQNVEQTADGSAEDSHAGYDHSSHSAAAPSIKLSENGLKNIGFEPFVVEPSDYVRQLTLPAIVVERPGRSQIHLTAPLTGIVTEIHAVTGEAVLPSQALFEMRLTHEELVAAQREFLRTAENLDVVNREIARLQSLGEGVVAGRRILEQEYEKQKLEASLHAESEAMLLHGISEEQVEEILRTRRLFRTITVRAPAHEHDHDRCSEEHMLQIQQLEVAQGEQVEAGQELAVLGDHCELHLEGVAFEDDARQIRNAAESGREITARPLAGDESDEVIEGLKILYVAAQIDAESRAFRVYVRLPNDVALERTDNARKQFIEWRYKPGQRMQLGLPVETWEDQLVLPTTAVIDEGAEAYVYQQNGSSFEQVSVHVIHRDSNAVVIANDGTLFRGDVIAGQGAFQMHLALKNKSGGAIDPHAGHNH